MALADTFQQIVDSLPDDWTDLELDLRIFDERRYIDAAVLLVTCNAQPYSKHDWHWRLLVAHRFGHAAAAPAVHAALKLLDDAEIDGRAGGARGSHRPGRDRAGADVGPDRVGAPGVQAAPRAVAVPRGADRRVRPRSAVRLERSRRARGGGHDGCSSSDEDALARELPGAELLVVDLTADPDERIEQARRLREPGVPIARVLLARRGRRPRPRRGRRLRPRRAALADGARGRGARGAAASRRLTPPRRALGSNIVATSGRLDDDPEPRLPPRPAPKRRRVELADAPVGCPERRQQRGQLGADERRIEPGDRRARGRSRRAAGCASVKR